MARIAGRNARVYTAIASGGSAEPIPFINSFTIDRATDRYDVTAYGDTSKACVQGLPDAKGQYTGFWDDSTQQLYTAAADGISRKTYVYSDIVNNVTKYWYGNVFWDTSESFPVAGAASISGSWAADGTWTKVG